MRHAHQDGFLQMIETSEVQRNVAAFKHERLISKAKVNGIDMLADPYLYDLKVLHNGGQRAKHSVGRRPETANSNSAERPRDRNTGDAQSSATKPPDATPVEKVRDLCKELGGDLRRNCQRLHDVHHEHHPIVDEYAESTDDKEDHKEVLAGIGNLFKSTVADLAIVANDGRLRTAEPGPEKSEADGSVPPAPVALKAHDQRCMSRALHREPAQRMATQRLGELVGFLIGSCGSVDSAFNTLNVNEARKLSIQEWEDGMRNLGFRDDVSFIFRLLGKNGDALASLDEIQALFDPFLKRMR
jgi:hypothetical protein